MKLSKNYNIIKILDALKEINSKFKIFLFNYRYVKNIFILFISDESIKIISY